MLCKRNKERTKKKVDNFSINGGFMTWQRSFFSICECAYVDIEYIEREN